MKKITLCALIALALITCTSAYADTYERDPVLGNIFTSNFKIPKDWKLITVDYSVGGKSQAILWFQAASGDVFIVNGDYSYTSFDVKQSFPIGKIKAY
jgi:hypothetical protein